ncbi:MAG: 6-phosphogluconolactonase [Actinomycetota bacterium]
MNSNPPLVVIHADPTLLAQAVAARLITKIVDTQAARGDACIVLTGGTMGSLVLEELAASTARDAVDWSKLTVMWGDERFLPAGHQDRNETQARRALLDHVPLDPTRVLAMPASDGPEPDVDQAAQRYSDRLNNIARASGAIHDQAMPVCDVLLLGVGPDAHVASLFPEMPGVYEQERTVIGVHGSPKPPPLRISLTLPAITTAEEVWCIVAGAEKAPAVRLSLSGAGPVQAPAAAAIGRRKTLWLLDRAAAAQVPKSLVRLSSP